MKKIIYLNIDKFEKRDGHKDIHFKIDGVINTIEVDSYYLLNPNQSLHQVLKNLFQTWRELLTTRQLVYLPIDISDEYIGYIKAKSDENRTVLSYGFTTEVQGWSLDLNNLSEFMLKIWANLDEELEEKSFDKKELIRQIDLTIESLDI